MTVISMGFPTLSSYAISIEDCFNEKKTLLVLGEIVFFLMM